MPKKLSELCDRYIRRKVHEEGEYLSEFRLKSINGLETFTFKKLSVEVNDVQKVLQTPEKSSPNKLLVLKKDGLKVSRQPEFESKFIETQREHNSFYKNEDHNVFTTKVSNISDFSTERMNEINKEVDNRNCIPIKRKLEISEDECKQFCKKLCKWAVKHKVKYNSTTSLLSILRVHSP